MNSNLIQQYPFIGKVIEDHIAKRKAIEEVKDLQHVYVEQVNPSPHDLSWVRAKSERQAKYPDVDFTNANPWLPEYNLDISPPQSEYERILNAQQDEVIEQLLGRLQYVVAEILETNIHGW